MNEPVSDKPKRGYGIKRIIKILCAFVSVGSGISTIALSALSQSSIVLPMFANVLISVFPVVTFLAGIVYVLIPPDLHQVIQKLLLDNTISEEELSQLKQIIDEKQTELASDRRTEMETVYNQPIRIVINK